VSGKDELITRAQAIADATGDNQTRIGFGAPGNHLKNVINEIHPTGKAWDESVRLGPWPLAMAAIGMYLDEMRVGPKVRVEVDNDHLVQLPEDIIAVTAIPVGGILITLLGGYSYGEGREVIVKDENGNASVANPLVVNVQGGGMIDMAAVVTLTTPFAYLRVYSQGFWYSICG